ncbi:MAG: TraK family protein [Planctomycetota bacterium]|jgi:hypothetical protein|nr:TraK family protein [Planctomycetota bacterium]
MKKKSLDEVMLAYAANRRDDERPRSLALFLTYRDDIQELYQGGWTYADIWRAMRDAGIIPFSYASFIRYAHKFAGQSHPSPSSKPIPSPLTASAPITSAVPVQSASDAGLPSWPKPNQNPAAVKPIAPGSTRVDMPVFGKSHKPRDPNSF